LGPDFYQFESYDKIISALETLETSFNQIANEIESKINDSRTRVSNISTRVSNCKHKIKQIEGTKKALAILSKPTFPKKPDLCGSVLKFSNEVPVKE
jgi:hypothetical protein